MKTLSFLKSDGTQVDYQVDIFGSNTEIAESPGVKFTVSEVRGGSDTTVGLGFPNLQQVYTLQDFITLAENTSDWGLFISNPNEDGSVEIVEIS